MSALKKYGRKWVSYSEVMMFRSEPARWLMAYPMGIRGSTNANMARGNAVEKAIEYALTDEFADADEAVDFAIKEFNRETALVVGKEDRDKQREDIEGYVRVGIEALSQFGVPTSTQNKLLIEHPDLPVPILGYDDFQFDKDGVKISVDLKTTKACPSSIREPHRNQGAVYATALPDHQIKFCYVTPKKSAVYEVTHAEAKELMQDFVKAVQAMEKFLSISDDVQELASFFAPSYSSFYWDDPIIRSEAKRIFGV